MMQWKGYVTTSFKHQQSISHNRLFIGDFNARGTNMMIVKFYWGVMDFKELIIKNEKELIPTKSQIKINVLISNMKQAVQVARVREDK